MLTAKLGTTVSVAVVGSSDDKFWFWSRNQTTASFRPALTLAYN